MPSKMEQLLRTHILAAINQRQVSIKEAAKHLHDLIREGHPNRELVLKVGAEMQAEKTSQINGFGSCA